MNKTRMHVLSAVDTWFKDQGNGSMRTLTIQHKAQRGPEPEHIEIVYSEITMVSGFTMDDEEVQFPPPDPPIKEPDPGVALTAKQWAAVVDLYERSVHTINYLRGNPEYDLRLLTEAVRGAGQALPGIRAKAQDPPG
jgi:hypothetical protein